VTATTGLASQLRQLAAGSALLPGDPAYETSRRVFNASIDRRPAAIWRCRSNEDVQRAVGAARDLGLGPTVRGGGHNVGGLAVSDGGLMIDLSGMTDVQVDPDAFTVSVGGGCTWARVDAATNPFDAAVPGGTVTTTGVGGLTLGGGVGWLAGSAGLSCDHLIGVDLVTADARHRFVDLRVDGDLLWALRGGGGNFGVVTQFHFSMVRVTVVLSGSIRLGIGDLPFAVARLARSASQMPDELTCSITLLSNESGEKHVSIEFVCAAANQSQGVAIVEWFAGCFDNRPPANLNSGYLQAQAMLEASFVKPRRCYWRSSYIDHVNGDFSAALLRAFSECESPRSVIILEHLHGAYCRQPEGGSAFSQRQRSFNLAIAAQWDSPVDDERNKTWCKRTYDVLRPFSCGSAYVNYVIPDQVADPTSLYDADSLARLRSVKARVDPSNLFRANHNIPPLGGSTA